MSDTRQLRFRILMELLEDLHVGSGLGVSGVYDSGQVRERNGEPYIPWTTLRGLAAEGAKRLCRIQPASYKASAMAALFRGEQGGGEGCSFTDLRVEGASHPLVLHSQTAIDHETGTALDHTLRTRECVPRGTTFVGFLEVFHPVDGAEKLLTDAVRITKSIGGGRRRGTGLVRFTITQERSERTRKDAVPISSLDPTFTVIRILAVAEEPITIVPGDQTTFTMRTLPYVPGATLLGALRHEWRTRAAGSNDSVEGTLAGVGTSFGDLLPLPPRVEKWTAGEPMPIPAPASLQLPKRAGASGSGEFATLGWAFQTPAGSRSLQDLGGADTLLGMTSVANPKGVPPGRFVWPDPRRGLLLYEPSLERRSRNAIDASRRSVREERGLFAQECIAAGTCFAGELVFFGAGAAGRASEFLAWAEGCLEEGGLLRIGRGRRALRITGISFHEPPVPDRASQTLTFTSPLALREGYGGYLTTLADPAPLQEALRNAGLSESEANAVRWEGPQQAPSTVARGFHYGGLPAFAKGGLGAGTCLSLLSCGNPVSLARAGQRGIGEGIAQGWGRFVLNHPVHSAGSTATALPPEAFPVDSRTAVFAAVNEAVERHQAWLSQIGSSQWGWLAEHVEGWARSRVSSPAAKLKELLRGRILSRGGEKWGEPHALLPGLVEGRGMDGTLFLRWFVRRMRLLAQKPNK